MKDGQQFIISPVQVETSPLDVEGIDLDLSAVEIVEAVREGRQREAGIIEGPSHAQH